MRTFEASPPAECAGSAKQRGTARAARRRGHRKAPLGLAAFLLWAPLASALLTTPTAGADAPTPAPARVIEVQEDYENEKIEAALYETGYFRSDVPLDGDTQAQLRAACAESGVPYALALAVIDQETDFRNLTGDGGESIGYMQIQPRWHSERMERLGVSDLTDPFGNFRVGCDYLKELLETYPLAEALTAYNSGKPGQSDYAEAVIGKLEAYQ